MEGGEQRYHCASQRAKDDGVAGGQRGRGDHNRCQNEETERVAQSTGEVEQAAELDDIVGQLRRCCVFGDARAGWPAYFQDDIEPSRGGDQNVTVPNWQREVEQVVHNQQRDSLSGYRQPTQTDKRIQLDLRV